jgi:transcriptional regulator with XRE-family HTH domain
MKQNEDLADLFRTERDRLGLSMRSAAKMMGTGFGHLCQIENRQHTNLTIKTLREAQLAFGVSSRRMWAAACETIAAAKEKTDEAR